MSYIKREHVRLALRDMISYSQDLDALHARHGMSLSSNLGRRNTIMSAAQEHFFAKALAKSYDGVTVSGKTGEPDILIDALGKELECKITTPTRAGGVCLQTDHATLEKKGYVDYLYVIADDKFEEFVVLHYTNLSTKDFARPHSSSRGRANLIKYLAHKKCNVLWGQMVSQNNLIIARLQSKLDNCGPRAHKTRDAIQNKINFWKKSPTQYKLIFERA